MQSVGLEIDHVVVCVTDLDDNPYELNAVPGGRHLSHGTENQIIPLGGSYIELVAVVDVDEARNSPFGSWVLERSASDGADAVCLRTETISEIANRLDLDVIPMSREKPDGTTLSWRLAGLQAALEQGLPFFIEWVDMDDHPGRSHINGASFLDSVIVFGDESVLTQWSGHVDRLKYQTGAPGVAFRVAGS